MKREITRIWRHRTKNLACVEYVEIDGDHRRELKEKDSLAPTTAFHNAFDALATHIAAPYLVHQDQHNKVRPQEIVMDRHENELRVKRMIGVIDAEGFEGDCKLKVPQQIPAGDCQKAVKKLITEAEKYIEGKRGEASLLDDAKGGGQA